MQGQDHPVDQRHRPFVSQDMAIQLEKKEILYKWNYKDINMSICGIVKHSGSKKCCSIQSLSTRATSVWGFDAATNA